MSLLKNLLDSNSKKDIEEVVETSDKEYTGKITKVDPKGYGFISSHEIPFTRIFFHWSALKQDTLNFTQLKKGMIVKFKRNDSKEHGVRAIKISVVQ